MMGRVVTALALLVVFLGQVVSSGLLTAWLIVRPGHRPQPGLVRIPFSGLSPTGAAMLGSMITLTPGTTTIDIDLERGEMLLHLLDASAPETAATEIHRRFELPMRRIFPPWEAT
ncbi:MAG: Na+/H+ antiporter subunit E [Myxococcales bacterium]|nr:Na+/H+ antiporter subunit E [Myxococcales bacterium]